MNSFDDDRTIRPQGWGFQGRGFALNPARGKFAGVCAGISDYTGVDVTLVRAAWILATVVGFGSLVIAYAAIAIIAD